MGKSWRREVAELFMFGKVPRVFRFEDVVKIARLVKPRIPDALVRRFMDEMDGLIFKEAPDGLIVNVAAFPPATIGDTVSVLFPGAVVSLHTVLGDKGVLNNYTPNMIAVRPRSQSDAISEIHYFGGNIRVYPIEDNVLELGDVADRLDRTYDYPRAMPEAALIHWFWLIKNSRWPSMDTQVDLEDVDLECVYQMADPFGLTTDIKEWVQRAKEREDYDDDERWRN